jgi:hypothetical protein
MSVWQDSNGGLHDDMNGAALSLPAWPKGMTMLTNEQVAAIELPVPSALQIYASLQASAMVALAKSDISMLRCVEAGVAVPDKWNIYRKSLRSIMNGTDAVSIILPTEPAFVVGT